MKYARLIVIACVLCALIVPLPAVAQSAYYSDVKGSVYSQAFPVSGAKVTLYSYDPIARVQVEQKATTTTDSRGAFAFPYVVFQPSGQFQYMVRAEKGSDVALALVLSYPGTLDTPAYVAPISLDLSVPSMYSDVTVTVLSTAVPTSTVPVPLPGATLILYSVDQATGNRTQIGTTSTTDAAGQHMYNLPYGTYVVRAEKGGMYKEQPFAAYQQVVGNVNLNTDLPVPTPTPTPGPTATPKPSATPGFEAVIALAALLGAAFYLRRA